MPFFHFFNCAALAFGPHVIYYKATPLSEYGTFYASLSAALVYMFTTLIKLILWATLLRTSEEEGSDIIGPFDAYQELLKAVIGLVDIGGLYYALTQVSYRNISYNHKFQAVGLGWALADALVQKALPLWVGARGWEFTWDYILQAVESNASLVLTISLSALGSLMWLRKNKPPSLVPFIYSTAGVAASMPFLTSYVRKELGWDLFKVVGFELSAAAATALVTWRLFVACQRSQST